MRRFRARWIFVGALVLVGLYFALDVVALQYLQSRGAAELARSMAAESAKIELGSVPFIPSFVGGRLARAEFDVRGASGGGGLRVQLVTVRMQDVRFSWRELLAISRSVFSARTEVKMSEGIGLMEIGETDLEEFVRRHVPQVGDVRIDTSGVAVRFRKSELGPGIEPTDGDLTEPARFLPRVANRRIVLTLVGVAQVPEEFRSRAERLERIINLPTLPEGLRTDVRLGDGVIVIEASGRDIEIDVGEGAS